MTAKNIAVLVFCYSFRWTHFHVLFLALGLDTFFKFVKVKFKAVCIFFTVFGWTHFYILFLFLSRTQLLICNSKLITVFIFCYSFMLDTWPTRRIQHWWHKLVTWVLLQVRLDVVIFGFSSLSAAVSADVILLGF